MKQETIQKLNQLNTTFYTQVAQSFSNSRQYPWPGWIKLKPYIQQQIETVSQPLQVLDLGCGNGRFGLFLQESFVQTRINYVGVDANNQLLKLAQQKIQNATNIFSASFSQLDIVNQPFPQQDWAIISLLGILHHIPSYQLRKQLLQKVLGSANQTTLIIITFWQFAKSARFTKKQIDPQKLSIDPSDLEPHDYILDWQRDQTAYRYCHFFDDQEIQKLITDLNCKIVTQYNADGKEQQLNKYLLLHK